MRTLLTPFATIGQIKKSLLLILTLCLGSQSAWAFNAFYIEDIRVEGLQRISAGTVFNYLPVKTGEYFKNKDAANVIQALYKADFFSDIQLAQAGDVLIVKVVERPAIADIVFNGNDEIDTEDLMETLKSINFSSGRVFSRSVLDQVESELQREYYSRGFYSATVTSTITPQERNRVNVQIDVSEGQPAKIHQIKIVGNKAFDEKTLQSQFELGPRAFWEILGSSDQYSKQKLSGDLENLRTYYLDRGYLNFTTDSTQVSLTEDKKNIYITVNITEGELYTIDSVKLLGTLILPEEDLQRFITIKQGEVFSRKRITAITEALRSRLGDEGYTFANVNPVPEPLADKKNKIQLSFLIDPGKRIYVRRINFVGNSKTHDEVLRRELRQMESAGASTDKIKRSETRLRRLNYFEEVNVETVPVPDVVDQVDVNYTVLERPSGNLLAGVGFSQTQGLLFNASVSQENFLGTGKQFGVSFNNSRVNTVYSLNYLDPYFTVDGISQGMSVYYRETNAEEANLSRYALDVTGARLTYGFPINENDSIKFGINPEQIKVKTTALSAREVFDYIDKNGDSFQTIKLNVGWSRDTRDRALFPTKGMLQSVSAEVSVPISDDLEYYKLSIKHNWYLPLTRKYIFLFKGQIGYGDSYGNSDFPFFENYTAGGPRTVRGFKENTLGPRDSNNNTLGGGLKVVGNIEFIMPTPFATESKSVRLSTFIDVGNVYARQADFDAGELRYSAGVALNWLSPIGALSFSLAKPLNAKDDDNVQIFQFTVGTNF
jgi:outer membrane protein insertion porin family